MKSLINVVCVFVILVLITNGSFNWNIVTNNSPKLVAVIYESSNEIPEPYVTGALNTLSESGLEVRVTDKDVVNGNNNVPAQIKSAIREAKSNGLPALVIIGENGKILKVQDLPKTKSEIIEAVK
tara:strand:- start:1002 stop:1376 length:375 start_codon:yes stop_codon:yes gene_type:complete